MSEHFRTPEDYELFLYTLPDRFASIRSSTITFIRLGTSLARVAGELDFDRGIRLVVRERLLYDRLPITIDGYGYEVWQGEDKLYWYDAQPHPNDPTCRQLSHITSTSRQTSNTIAFQLAISVSLSRICLY